MEVPNEHEFPHHRTQKEARRTLGKSGIDTATTGIKRSRDYGAQKAEVTVERRDHAADKLATL